MRKIVHGKIGMATALLIVLMMLLGSSMSLGLGASEKIDVLIGFHNMSERAQNRAMVRAFGGDIYAEFNLVDVIAARMTPQQAAALSRNPKIDYIELDAEVYALEQTTPWGIDRVFGDESYSFPTWGTPPEVMNKGAGIGVAVLDTGIDVDHEDLNVVGGKRFYLRGLTLRSDDQYNDVYGHGTHVAGTIAALDNGLGVVGVAPEVSLYAVKVLGDNGSGSTSAIIAGIQWVCEQNNISIINMSLGSSYYSSTFDAACKKAYLEEGILIVASAGNSGNDAGTGDTVGYPAKYDSVIAVAASDSSDDRAYFSSTGPDVDLIAPGVNIMSTVPDSQYEEGWSGTSMASPHVAGTAALVWAENPMMSNGEVWSILTKTAEKLYTTADVLLPKEHQGYGLVRADLAVDAVSTPVTQYIITASAGSNGTIDPSGTVSVNDGAAQSFLITPNSGYQVADVTVDGASVGAVSSYIFSSVTSNHTIHAIFKEISLVNELSISITSPAPNSTYKWNDVFVISAKVVDQNITPVNGASVTIEVFNPNGSLNKRYSGITSAAGEYSVTHKVANKALTGIYSIEATASFGDLSSVSPDPQFTFTVIKR